MIRPRRDAVDSPSSRPPLRLKYVEAVLSIGFALAFIAWTRLSAPGPLAPNVDPSSSGGPFGLDLLLPAPAAYPRSAAGQLAEAFAILTHPLIVLAVTATWVVYAYTGRMRRLSVSLAIAATGIPVQFLIALHLARPTPGAAFADSIAAFAHAYPNAHVTAMTLASWVLVTLARAHHRSTMVATGTVLGYAAVVMTAVSQWYMGLATLSDLIGGFLLGAAFANLALWVGGIDAILTSWVNRRLSRASSEKRAAVIYNPTKFDDLSLLRRRVAAEVRATGWRPTVWLETTPDDPGRSMASRALEAGVDLVMVAGGDGTVRAVSSQLAGTEMPMALIPAGTGNLLARNLSIPLDTDAAIRLALHGRLQPIDMVTCTFDDGEERFVVMAGMGLDAQIMESTDSGLKKVIRSGAYAVAAVQNAVPDPFTATITLDDAPPERRQMVMALMGNVGTITAGMTLFPRAVPTDGMVDLLLANPGKVVDWARLGAQILTGQEMEGFTLTRARKVLIEADRPVPFELDGDTAGSTRTLRAEVQDGALHVVVPR
ncbi:diacylglycerol kinase family protein [Actinomyces naeslundii]|uniref:diacylglycerol kinase family protein n=1 Tax=Actinomyces naeslundii TaxID=1655 RepID=UPI0028D61D55|nr:diacylglycerol kinase family protein [Actinomyces naeslundii]